MIRVTTWDWQIRLKMNLFSEFERDQWRHTRTSTSKLETFQTTLPIQWLVLEMSYKWRDQLLNISIVTPTSTFNLDGEILYEPNQDHNAPHLRIVVNVILS